MESSATYAKQLQAVLNNSLDMRADIDRLVKSINLDADEWQWLYTHARGLAHTLSELDYKYGAK